MKHCPNCYEPLRNMESKCHVCGYNLTDITKEKQLTDRQLHRFRIYKWVDRILRGVYIIYIIVAIVLLHKDNIYFLDHNFTIILLAVSIALLLRSIISSLSFKNWRCPNCDKYLSKLKYNAKYCHIAVSF
jgi:predicted amidophosphoribosyltransferase